MELIESIQYLAVLTVSGAWKETSQKIHEELCRETLTQFYKIMNGLTPEYLKIPALSQRCHLFGYRKSNDLEDIASKNQRYENSFFPE